ncbi:MAG: acyl-CoA thioesterase [Firmicutes bacterium HGW-Firmicutes-14]|jgi:acyl-CoA thioester hydrolase|nr:MAG: acyl-CoA thioesterase [Firmicutes bacterium HGW-Firmicutes-14]
MDSEFSVENSTQIRVRYEETDQMGFVYYGNHFTWFEVGRTELFRSMGLPYTMFEARGIMLPVAEAECKYKSSARYDDLVTIRTVITKLTPVRIVFGYQLISEEGRILAYGSTTHAFVNSSGRPVNITKSDLELWKLITSSVE